MLVRRLPAPSGRVRIWLIHVPYNIFFFKEPEEIVHCPVWDCKEDIPVIQRDRIAATKSANDPNFFQLFQTSEQVARQVFEPSPKELDV